MEAMNERQRYICNPFRLVRALAELALRPPEPLPYIPYNEVNYPKVTNVEAPVATEEELSA